MDPAQLLRERERRLLAEYSPSHPPQAFDAGDLHREDRATAEHWLSIYTELVEFLHSVMETAPDHAARASGRRAMDLQAKILELHLAYWTDRLERLREDPGPGTG